MTVRQDFGILPPKDFLLQILENLPKIYIFLWEKKNNMNRLRITWKELAKVYNKNSFRTSLRKLLDKGLLNYEEFDDSVAIELVGWDDVMED